MSRTTKFEKPPMLSVVIPVYNDPRGIRMTLESLTAQTYSANDYEVLAVDNGSTDETREVIRSFTSFYDHVHLLVEDEVQGSYAARNEGVRHARGELVSFVDADVTVEENWAESVVASFEEHGWDYMGCTIELYVEGEETLGSTYDELLGGFPVERYMKERDFTVTACLSIRHELFEEVGPFDARLASHGDEEFGKRVAAAGLDQQFEPEIIVYHPARATLHAWLEKQFRIGRGAVQMRTYHPNRKEIDHPLSPKRFLPPRPRQFYARLADSVDPTVREAGALYALDYLSKLARTGGGIYERIKQSRASGRRGRGD